MRGGVLQSGCTRHKHSGRREGVLGARGTSTAARVATYRLPTAIWQLVHAALHTLVVIAAAGGAGRGHDEGSGWMAVNCRRLPAAPAGRCCTLAALPLLSQQCARSSTGWRCLRLPVDCELPQRTSLTSLPPPRHSPFCSERTRHCAGRDGDQQQRRKAAGEHRGACRSRTGCCPAVRK